MEKLNSYEPGANITIMNTWYDKPEYTDRGSYRFMSKHDFITIVYKDCDTGEKHFASIEDPKYTYYLTKKDKEADYNRSFVDKNDVYPVVCDFRNLEKDMAKKLNRIEEYEENIKSGNSRSNKMIHCDPRVFCSDLTIDSFYRMEFDRTYQNETCSIDKAYLDIETDIKYINGNFPQSGECPVNAVSLMIEKTNTEYVFLLKDKNNPNVEKFEEYVNTYNFTEEFHQFLTENVGGPGKLEKFNLSTLQYEIHFYDNELELIGNVFALINKIQPDFVLAWNMSFDIPFLIERIRVLGYNPEDIICHDDFVQSRNCWYYIDQKNLSMFEARGDYAKISSYSVYLDQMIQFASRRKGQSAFSSFKLDSIGEVIAGVRKLDYHHIAELADLPYVDYKTFVMYNMMDVLVQKCIEEKTNDINYVFNKTVLNSTVYAKIHRQTVYLANRAAMFYWDRGFIIGNNVNKFNDKPTEKFAGAFVANPTLVSPVPKCKLISPGGNPIPINVMHNGNDFDYKALYPSLIREFNIAPHTQIGMIQILNTIYQDENPLNDPKFQRAGCFIENLASHNYIEFGHRWFNLGTYKEVLNDIYEYFAYHEIPVRPIIPSYTNIIFYRIEGLQPGDTPLFIRTRKPNSDLKFKCKIDDRYFHRIPSNINNKLTSFKEEAQIQL